LVRRHDRHWPRHLPEFELLIAQVLFEIDEAPDGKSANSSLELGKSFANFANTADSERLGIEPHAGTPAPGKQPECSCCVVGRHFSHPERAHALPELWVGPVGEPCEVLELRCSLNGASARPTTLRAAGGDQVAAHRAVHLIEGAGERLWRHVRCPQLTESLALASTVLAADAPAFGRVVGSLIQIRKTSMSL